MAESKVAVVVALVGNAGLAVVKGASAAATGSAAMLAETFHSISDTGNLRLGVRGVGEVDRRCFTPARTGVPIAEHRDSPGRPTSAHVTYRAMRRVRVLTLILVGYLFLDIANPMMPGAVQIVDGVIQVVQAVQAERSWIGAEPPCQTMLLQTPLALAPNRLSRPLRPLRRDSRPPRRGLLRPRSPAPPSVSSADDH